MAGELAPEVADRYELKGRVATMMIDLMPSWTRQGRSWEARPVSRYPAVDLDMAYLVDDDVPAAELDATVREVAGDLAESVVLFDVWRDAALGEQTQPCFSGQAAGGGPHPDRRRRGGGARTCGG